MEKNDHFYSLLYHGLMQKKSFSKDYIVRLHGMASSDESLHLESRSAQCELLQGFIRKKGYAMPKPTDLSVGYKICKEPGSQKK